MPDLMQRLQASVGCRFRIMRELTGGGMSRVFLAEESELRREVAIKVLCTPTGDETLIQRFHDEVLQTARLQHPTIVTVLAVGTIDDETTPLPYYVMPYVRGESLRSRLRQDASLSLGAALRILRDVLDAVSYAHAHGVVHRDIKPENIFLDGGSAVLADFGVAKALSGAPRAASPTLPGTTVGTPAYMAPEQIAGDDDTDGRADLYSVGVVAFEMLTGQLPWGQPGTAQMLAAKVTGAHARLRVVRPDVPPPMAAALERCLACDPADRPQSAEELLRVIEGMATLPTPVTPMPARRMAGRPPARLVATVVSVAAVAVAVLWAARSTRTIETPLAGATVRLAVLNPSLEAPATPDSTVDMQLYRELVAALYPIPGLALVHESEITRMVELGIPPDVVIRKLRGEGFDSALALEIVAGGEGGVQLQLQLQALQRGQREPVGNPVVLRSRLRLPPDSARALAGALASQVVSRLGLAVVDRQVRETGSGDASLARSRGRDAVARRTPEGIREAIGYYERAIALDPAYAQAHADLADALALALFYRYDAGAPAYAVAARARLEADRAVGLQPSLAEGFTARGYVGMVSGAPVAFVRANYDRARQLHPENPNSRLWYAGLLALEHRYPQALDTLRELIRLDPGSPSKRISFALYSMPLHRYDDAVVHAAEASRLQPGLTFAAALQLWGLVLQGGERGRACDGVEAGPYLGARAACLERTQGGARAQRLLDSLVRLATHPPPSGSLYEPSLFAAELSMHAATGADWDAARLWMRRAFVASPAGIEPRLLRSGLYRDELVRLGDSLRADAWREVEALAQRTRRAQEGHRAQGGHES